MQFCDEIEDKWEWTKVFYTVYNNCYNNLSILNNKLLTKKKKVCFIRLKVLNHY